MTDLLGTGRSEDGASYGSAQQTWTHKGSEGGFVAGASARDDGDLGFGGIRAEVDNLILFLESTVGVCDGDRLESGEDEVGGVVDEVFCFRHKYD